MIDSAAIEDRFLYDTEKLLEDLPGKPHDTTKDLSALLENSEAEVSIENNRQLKQIRDYLKDKIMADLTRLAIRKKVAALANPPINHLPQEALMCVFSFFPSQERLRLSHVCNRWRVIAQDRNYWLRLLVQEANVSREEIDDLIEPHGVYQRFMKIKEMAATNVIYKRYLEGVRWDLPHMLDSIEGIREHFKSFVSRGCKFNLDYVMLTGYLPFVQYVIAATHVTPNESSLGDAVKSGSLPLVQYLIETYHLKPNESMLDKMVSSSMQHYLKHVMGTSLEQPEISKKPEALRQRV